MTSTPPPRPTPLSGGSSPAPRRSAAHSLYGMQVRAFLEAAEVVDADPEVIEDILDGFPLDSSPDDPEDEDAEVDVEGGPGPGTTGRDEESDADNEAEDDPEQEEFAAYLEEGKVRARLVGLSAS